MKKVNIYFLENKSMLYALIYFLYSHKNNV